MYDVAQSTDQPLAVAPSEVYTDSTCASLSTVIECVRKIALVGLPVFFVHDALPQLTLGLIICFFRSGLWLVRARVRVSGMDRVYVG